MKLFNLIVFCFCFTNTILYANDIVLTENEKVFIKNNPVIKVLSTKGFEPFVIQNKDGSFSGYDRDILNIIEQKTGLKFKYTLIDWSNVNDKVINGEYDGFSAAFYTDFRAKNMLHSKPYFKSSTYVVTQKGNPLNINKLEDLNNKTVALSKSNILFENAIKNLNLNIKIVWVETLSDTISAVVTNNADFTVLDEAVFYLSKVIGIQDKIDTPFIIGNPFELFFWFKKEHNELPIIVNKVLDSIKADKEIELRYKWFKPKEEFDYELFYKIFGVIFIVILFIFYRQYLLKRTNEKLEFLVNEKTKELKLLNKSLEEKIQEQLIQIREKDKVLLHQSRMSAIAEMISNIAHQWRQPLAAISMSTGIMQVEIEIDEKSSKEEQLERLTTINDNLQYLSETINDFYSFYHSHDCLKDIMNIKELLKKSELLVKNSFEEEQIKIYIEYEEDIYLKVNENHFIQVLLNIYENCKDAILLNKPEQKLLFISLIKENDYVVIKIKDNGGGIDEDILEKIFDPYTTTKHQSRGTGLGLYLSYQVITRLYKGYMEVHNVLYKYQNTEYTGAEFIIKIPQEPVN